MRIAQIVPSLESQHGGPSRSVRQLALALSAEAHEVELLATEPGAAQHQTEGALQIHIFPRVFPASICRSPALAAHLDRAQFDVVHHHALWLRTLHYAARRAHRQPAVPLVISPRGMMTPWAWGHHRWRKEFAGRFVHSGALTTAAGWHATSAAEADDIRRLGFNQPICVAPNSVSIPPPAEVELARQHWEQLCPEVAGRRVALFYSRFHRKKRLLELIDLWLAESHDDWLLLVVGIPEGYSLADLVAHASRHKSAHRIRFFTGDHHPPPYAVASLFLLPSHSENFGLVIAEAMAHGVPVLVTDTTPWQAVNDRQCGWCLPWADYARALADALGENPAALQNRGEHAREWIAAEFSWQKSARLLVDFYRQLKGGPR